LLIFETFNFFVLLLIFETGGSILLFKKKKNSKILRFTVIDIKSLGLI
jgi:hypothetical protein